MNASKENKPFVLLGTDEPYLKQIPERLTKPLCLAHAGNSYDNIAADLRIPLGTVKSRINRARERVLKMRIDAANLEKERACLDN